MWGLNYAKYFCTILCRRAYEFVHTQLTYKLVRYVQYRTQLRTNFQNCTLCTYELIRRLRYAACVCVRFSARNCTVELSVYSFKTGTLPSGELLYIVELWGIPVQYILNIYFEQMFATHRADTTWLQVIHDRSNTSTSLTPSQRRPIKSCVTVHLFEDWWRTRGGSTFSCYGRVLGGFGWNFS